MNDPHCQGAGHFVSVIFMSIFAFVPAILSTSNACQQLAILSFR